MSIERSKKDGERSESLQVKQKDLVIESLLSVLKTRSKKNDEINSQLKNIIKDLEKKGSIDWPKVLSRVLEIVQSKNKEIRDLKETTITLAKENTKLSAEIKDIKESIGNLTEMNLDILQTAQSEQRKFHEYMKKNGNSDISEEEIEQDNN